MDNKKKKSIWIIGGLLAVAAIVLAVVLICGNKKFTQTTIYPDESLSRPSDTTFVVNGIAFKMIGIQGGVLCGKELKDEIELPNFYIGETEVTYGLWSAVMDDGLQPSEESAVLPITDISLDDCFDFLDRLDSITGCKFYVPPYEHWLYAAYYGKSAQKETNLSEIAWHSGNSNGKANPVKSKKPDGLGLYDMVGNVEEWTISGPDPLFIIAGGSYQNDSVDCSLDSYSINHADVKMGHIGLRLIMAYEK